MGKFISNVFLGALALGLSIFTASRTLDLLAWALPSNQTIYQWLGLAAFEGGMYFWAFFFVMGAKGTPQRSISVLMAVFSIIAVCVATIADLSLDAGQAGKGPALSPAMQQTMIVFLGVTISLNVAAFLACKLMSIENLRSIREGVAEDHIYSEGLRAIDGLTPQIAAEAAPYLAAEWSTRTWQRIVPGVQRQTQYVGPVRVTPAPAPAPQMLAQTTPAPQLPAPEKRRGGGFLGRLFGKGEPETVALAQTGELGPAPAPVTAPAAAPSPEPVSAPSPHEPHEKLTPMDAIRTARRAGAAARRNQRTLRRGLRPGSKSTESARTRGTSDL